MLRTSFGATLLVPLVVVLISCGADDEGQEIEGFITIERPTDDPGYETYEDTVHLSGPRSTLVESASWTNAAGGTGPAALTFQRNCYAFIIVFPECNHEWNASIPLVIGMNVITVTGYGSDGDFGRDTITVTRLRCSPPPATPFAQWPLACR